MEYLPGQLPPDDDFAPPPSPPPMENEASAAAAQGENSDEKVPGENGEENAVYPNGCIPIPPSVSNGGDDMLGMLMEVRDDINCSCCYEILEEPKTLTCSHTFCGGCLQKIIDKSQSRYAVRICCPLCRVQSEVPSGGFATNNFMKELISKLKAMLPKRDEALNCLACKKLFKKRELFICTDSHDQLEGKSKQHASGDKPCSSTSAAATPIIVDSQEPGGVGPLCSMCILAKHNGHNKVVPFIQVATKAERKEAVDQVRSIKTATREVLKASTHHLFNELKNAIEFRTLDTIIKELNDPTKQFFEPDVKAKIAQATEIGEKGSQVFGEVTENSKKLVEMLLNTPSKTPTNESSENSGMKNFPAASQTRTGFANAGFGNTGFGNSGGSGSSGGFCNLGPANAGFGRPRLRVPATAFFPSQRSSTHRHVSTAENVNGCALPPPIASSGAARPGWVRTQSAYITEDGEAIRRFNQNSDDTDYE